ncbi:MAG: N-acetyltransferase DgcN [Pseudomonadota bacterium]
MDIPRPYLLFLGDAPDRLAIKTALGVVDWRPDWCVGEWRLSDTAASAGLANLSPLEAAAQGAKTLVIGVVNPGGVLPEPWIAALTQAIEAGLNIASGMHRRLDSIPDIAEAARRAGAELFDLRLGGGPFAVGTGAKRSGKRLLTVGTDCSVGKKYAALAIADELAQRGAAADFRATGQTGVLLAGGGVAIDAVVADFISGAAESVSPENAPDHWDVIEGQGSLFHPAFAGVSLGLLHGSQPDAFVVCHEPTRTTMRNNPYPIASIDAVIEATIAQGRLTNPAIRPAGLAINTAALDEGAAHDCLAEAAERYGLPACDPLRGGVGAICDHLQAAF